MNAEHENFIGIYKGAFSKEYCEEVINYFEQMSKAGYAVNRQQHDKVNKIHKDNLSVFFTQESIINLTESKHLLQQFNNTLWGVCYPAYTDKFWILKELAGHSSYCFKVQKTEIGQGYHVWHCEVGNRSTAHRILAWTLYLNNVEEGGETEFIYQHMRIKPTQGTLVMWPAVYTHTHRGNPPISNDKYIVTGWIEF
jgi:hypothetical protein